MFSQSGPSQSHVNSTGQDIQKFKGQDVNELKMMFRLTDENGDGSVTAEELSNMLTNKLGIDLDQSLLADLMTSAGAHSQGLISESQFISWFVKMQSLSCPDTDQDCDLSRDLLAAFKLFDKDNNGYITKEELKKAMDLIDEKMSDGELNSLIKMADSDKDGRIDYQEFLRILL